MPKIKNCFNENIKIKYDNNIRNTIIKTIINIILKDEFFHKTRSRATDKIKNTPKCGSESLFIPINEKNGAKIFKNIKDRNRSFYIQKKMFDLGLSPEVGDRFTLSVELKDFFNGKLKAYGFLTKIVKCPINKKDLKKISNHYNKIGIKYEDFRACNFGYDENKNILCIDFGERSCSKYPKIKNIKKQEIENVS